MLFDGQELKDIVSHLSKQIELRNEYDRCYKTISASQALSLDVTSSSASGIGGAFVFCACAPRNSC